MSEILVIFTDSSSSKAERETLVQYLSEIEGVNVFNQVPLTEIAFPVYAVFTDTPMASATKSIAETKLAFDDFALEIITEPSA